MQPVNRTPSCSAVKLLFNFAVTVILIETEVKSKGNLKSDRALLYLFSFRCHMR